MYAVGPSPARPGQIIGSAGPTTTARMGRYLPALFAAGVRAVIGKGELHGARHGRIHDARSGLLRGDRRSRRAAGQADRVGDRDRPTRISAPRRSSRSTSMAFPGGRHHRLRREQFPRNRARAMAPPALSEQRVSNGESRPSIRSGIPTVDGVDDSTPIPGMSAGDITEVDSFPTGMALASSSTPWSSLVREHTHCNIAQTEHGWRPGNPE